MRILGLAIVAFVASGCTIHVVNEPASASLPPPAVIPVTAAAPAVHRPAPVFVAAPRARPVRYASEGRVPARDTLRTAAGATPTKSNGNPAQSPIAARPTRTIKPRAEHVAPKSAWPERIADRDPEPRDAQHFASKRRERSTNVAKAQ